MHERICPLKLELTTFWRCLTVLIAAVSLVGCRSAYYAAWETLGKHKRDLLRDYVGKTRSEQEAAKTEFKDALTRLKEITSFDGGKLEQAYRQVEKDYSRCRDRSESIRSRIKDVEDVAAALFAEWEKELAGYSSENLRSSSRAKLQETRQRYEGLRSALWRSAESMSPVLAKLKDQSLFLKHNLNAQAIGSLKGEVVSIESDVQKLIAEMNAAIARADEFMKDLP
jgi:ElaB/YqjD/DUF883 family membrane-anchored ribosome-binding protein